VLETASDLAECITQDVKGKRVGSVSKYFKFGSRFTGHARSFRGTSKKTTDTTHTNTVAFSPSPIPSNRPLSLRSDYTDSTSTSDGRPSPHLHPSTPGTSVSSSNRSDPIAPAQSAATATGYEQPSMPPRPQSASPSGDRLLNGSSPDPCAQIAAIFTSSLRPSNSREESRSASPLHQNRSRLNALGLPKHP
jgi:hypothetical protein